MKHKTNSFRHLCWAYGCDWTPEAMRGVYEAIIKSWRDAGAPPDQLVARAPGMDGRRIGKWGTFRRRHKRLEDTKFQDVDHFSISSLNQYSPRDKDDIYPDYDWRAYATLSARGRYIYMGWIPSLISAPDSILIDLFYSACKHGYAIYGHRHYKNFILQDHFEELSFSPPLRELRITNAQAWRPPKSSADDHLLLQDVYHHNYLSNARLDAPFGKTAVTLREWIEDEPANRGDLRPFTDFLTEWTPPQERIPEIREALFRAGRLFYHRFFKELDYDRVISKDGRIAMASDTPWKDDPSYLPVTSPPERFHRPDIHAPWESPEPIPEMFRAEWYRSLDPSLTP